MPIAYKLSIDPQLSRVHNAFRNSMLCTHLPDPNHQISYNDLQVDEKLDVPELRMRIFDEHIKSLRNRQIPMVKVE